MVDRMVSTDPPLSDQELHDRTEELLRAAERVSLELRLQTERLAAAIESFEHDVSVLRHKGSTHG